jgi:hypothetical protein
MTERPQTVGSYFNEDENPMEKTPTFPYGFPPMFFKSNNSSWKSIAKTILVKFDDQHSKFLDSVSERYKREDDWRKTKYYASPKIIPKSPTKTTKSKMKK